MPGDEFSTVVSGRPLEIPAATWNAMLVAAKAEADRQAGLGREAQRAAPQRTIISVKNSTDGDRARFEVMGLAVPLFTVGDSFKERPAMKGNKPDIAVHFGRIAICLEPIPFLGVGRCCVSGVTVAKCDFTEKWHEWADIKHDSMTSLESRVDPGGAYVLWSPGETGVQWCLVRISNPPPKHFPARILSATSIGETQGRYTYTFQEVEKTDGEHAGWQNKAGGRCGYAYNLIENRDDAETAAARQNVIVWMEEVFYSAGGEKTTEYWFQHEEYDETTTGEGTTTTGEQTTTTTADPQEVAVAVCGMFNLCGEHISFPQKNLIFPASLGIRIEDLAPGIVSLTVCEGTTTTAEETTTTTAEETTTTTAEETTTTTAEETTTTTAEETTTTTAEACEWCWEVSGDITPDARGWYLLGAGLRNGKCWWDGPDNWIIWWNSGPGWWEIINLGNANQFWYKPLFLGTPAGNYSPNFPHTDGIASVAVCPATTTTEEATTTTAEATTTTAEQTTTTS